MDVKKVLWIIFAFVIIGLVLQFSYNMLSTTQEGIITRSKQIENY